MNDNKTTEVFRMSDGDVRFWIVENSTVHLKAVTKFGDPVELSADELEELIMLLSKLYDKIKD